MKERLDSYWSIRQGMTATPDTKNVFCPASYTQPLAEVPTRLKKLDSQTQDRITNWGYASCDASLRTHYVSTLAKSSGFPYPSAKP